MPSDWPTLPAVKAHFRALPYGEVSGALERVEASGASQAAKLCLRFLVLTAARSGEARGATWAEMDAEAREWRIPGERMKGGAAHRVPLSDAALTVSNGCACWTMGAARSSRPRSERGIHCQICHLRSCYGTAGWPAARPFTGSGVRFGTGARRQGSHGRLPRPALAHIGGEIA